MQLTDTGFSSVFKNLMRKSVDKIIAKVQQALGTSDVHQMGECNENIENLLKIIEKRHKTIEKTHTSSASYSLFFSDLPWGSREGRTSPQSEGKPRSTVSGPRSGLSVRTPMRTVRPGAPSRF